MKKHKIRPAREEDIAFVIDSWWRSHCKNIKYDKQDYIDQIKFVIDLGMVIVSCDPEDDRVIYGWLCFDYYESIPVIHYCYFKKHFRGFGFSKDLINSVVKKDHEFLVTHKNDLYHYPTKFTSFILYPRVKL